MNEQSDWEVLLISVKTRVVHPYRHLSFFLSSSFPRLLRLLCSFTEKTHEEQKRNLESGDESGDESSDESSDEEINLRSPVVSSFLSSMLTTFEEGFLFQSLSSMMGRSIFREAVSIGEFIFIQLKVFFVLT